jgi:hypothetical protein
MSSTPVMNHWLTRLEREGEATLSKPKKYHLSLSLSFFRRKEEDEKATTDCARGHKGAHE